MTRLIQTFSVFFLFALLVGACGIPDQGTPQPAAVVTQSLSCGNRNAILVKGESAAFDFKSDSGGKITARLDTGDSLTYFNWGTLKQNNDTSVTYTAPDFVPESRRIGVTGTLAVDKSTPANCYAYLLDDFTYGVIDDGTTKGLLATSYATTDITKIDTLPVKEKGLIRDFNFPSIPGLFTGVSSLPAGTYSLRIKGTLLVDGGNYWFRFTSTATTGTLSIDGQKRGNSAGGTGAELPAPSTPLSVTPNYNTGIALSPGKHSIVIDIPHSANASYKLEWTTTKPTTTVKPYTVIPPSAFDRD